MAKQSNPFLDFDITKMMSDVKVPGVDVDAVVSAQQKNMDAVNTANKLAFEGMQAIMQRQAELLRQGMEDASAMATQVTSTTSPTDRMAKQTEITKELFERSLSNMRELSEMVAKSNNEVLDLLNKRFTDSLSEVKTALEKAPQQGFDLSQMMPSAAKPAAKSSGTSRSTAAKAAE